MPEKPGAYRQVLRHGTMRSDLTARHVPGARNLTIYIYIYTYMGGQVYRLQLFWDVEKNCEDRHVYKDVDAMLDFRLNYNMCTIDWQPEEEDAEDEDETDDNGTDEGADDEGSDDEGGTGEDDEGSDDEGDTGEDDDEEPIDYDGPDYTLDGHTNNEVASNVSEPTALDGLRVYPNPARTTLTVASNAIDATWQLTDMRGRTVANWTQTERMSSFNVADLPRGQYVLIGRLEEGTTTHRRVILH